jgi:K+-sensing histidine kinase KdpD
MGSMKEASMQVLPAQRCVIVGVNGSPNSIVALRKAATEARCRHARLDVVRVLAPDSGPGSEQRPLPRTVHSNSPDLLHWGT